MRPCQLCARPTRLERGICSRHHNYYWPVSVSRRKRDTRKFDPAPIKYWIETTGPVARVCREAGINRRFFYRNHRLQANTVDRYCCALGLHPMCLYGEEWLTP